MSSYSRVHVGELLRTYISESARACAGSVSVEHMCIALHVFVHVGCMPADVHACHSACTRPSAYVGIHRTTLHARCPPHPVQTSSSQYETIKRGVAFSFVKLFQPRVQVPTHILHHQVWVQPATEEKRRGREKMWGGGRAREHNRNVWMHLLALSALQHSFHK
jgi:hypothetical protein